VPRDTLGEPFNGVHSFGGDPALAQGSVRRSVCSATEKEEDHHAGELPSHYAKAVGMPRTV